MSGGKDSVLRVKGHCLCISSSKSNRSDKLNQSYLSNQKRLSNKFSLLLNSIIFTKAEIFLKNYFTNVSLNSHTDCHRTLQFIIMNQYLLTWLLYGSVPIWLQYTTKGFLHSLLERFTFKKGISIWSSIYGKAACHGKQSGLVHFELIIYKFIQPSKLPDYGKRKCRLALNTFLCLLDYDLLLSNCV